MTTELNASREPDPIDAVHFTLESVASRLEFLGEQQPLIEARDFVRYGEEGLAWEMLAYLINTRISEVPGSVIEDIIKIAVMWKIDVQLTHPEL